MRPTVWSSYFIELSPEEMVETFVGAGWTESELSDEHAKVLLEQGDPAAEGKRFRKFAADRGMSFPQGHLWLQCDILADNQDEVIDDLKRWLDLFAAVGVQNAVLHPGGGKMIADGAPADEIMAARVRALRALCGHCEPLGVTICLENIVRTAPLAKDLLGIIEAVGAPNLAICLDTGHLNMVKGNQAEFIRETGKHLKALHIADNEGEKDQHIMPYGKGTVAWPQVVSALKEIGYDGLFNLEIGGERRCPHAIQLAKLDYLKRVLPMMLDGAN
jgi:sugar phosphate isomerase/epimerase